MDPNELYKAWCRAVLSEDKLTANEAYIAIRAWLDRGGFEPEAFSVPSTRKQFFQYDLITGRIL